jgi:hypothetical protein
MTPASTGHPPTPAPSDETVGLRFRVWFACLAGALAVAIGVWVLAGTLLEPTVGPRAWVLLAWLLGLSGLGIAVGAFCAAWLDRGLVGHARALNRGLAGGRASDLRGLPAAGRWGEFAELTDRLQALLSERERDRAAARTHSTLLGDIARLRDVLESEEPMPVFEGPVGEISRGILRMIERERDILASLAAEALATRAELSRALEDARESAEQSERGFVEATAMLTTVRELSRLGGELHEAVQAPADASNAALEAAWVRQRDAAAGALEELIEASSESVQHLGEALGGVREVADQVQRVSNHATLLALNALVSDLHEPAEGARVERGAELQALAREVRVATDRTTELARSVDRDVATASLRMHEVRARIAARFEGLAEPEWPAAGSGDLGRRLERVREMIQDATRKGERLSSAGERASRAAERLTRRIEEQVQAVQSLAGQLAPDAGPAPDADPANELHVIDAGDRPLDGESESTPEHDDDARPPGTKERPL